MEWILVYFCLPSYTPGLCKYCKVSFRSISTYSLISILYNSYVHMNVISTKFCMCVYFSCHVNSMSKQNPAWLAKWVDSK